MRTIYKRSIIRVFVAAGGKIIFKFSFSRWHRFVFVLLIFLKLPNLPMHQKRWYLPVIPPTQYETCRAIRAIRSRVRVNPNPDPNPSHNPNNPNSPSPKP